MSALMSVAFSCALLGTIPPAAMDSGAKEPTLNVQVVDSSWLPVPGLTIRVSAVSDCEARRRVSRIDDGMTDRAGSVRWSLPRKVSYVVEAGGESGFERVRECLLLRSFSSDQPTAYLQLRIGVVIPKDPRELKP